MRFELIKNRFIINPFFWFSFVWIVILAFQLLNFVTIYPQLSDSLLSFFLIILTISVLCSIFYDHFFLKKRKVVLINNDKPCKWLTIICVLAFVIEVVYSKMIPLVEVIQGNTGSYSNFGIPHLTFVIVSLTIALSTISSIKLIYGKEHKIGNLVSLLLCFAIFGLSYSRGILILSFLITLVAFLSKYRFGFLSFVGFVFLAIIGSFLFNIAGNIRSNASWNDSSFIMDISGFNPQYNFLKDFSWVIVYAESPIGNLSYNFANIPSQNNLLGLFSQLLPDFLSKRLFPQFDSSLFLVQPGLTVSSMFAGGYKYYGLFGMTLSYLELVVFIFLCAFITRKNTQFFLATTASLSIISALTFFDNMVTYSGYSFFLIFFVVGRIFAKKDDFAYKAEFLKSYATIFPERFLSE